MTEAMRRAQKKYYEKIKSRPEVRAAGARRSNECVKRLRKDPANRAMVYAIKDYKDDRGIKLKELANLIGCTAAHLYRVTGMCCKVKPEEFKKLPPLYQKLMEISGEGEK